MKWFKSLFEKDYSDWISFNVVNGCCYSTRIKIYDGNRNLNIKIKSNIPIKAYLISSKAYNNIKETGDFDLSLQHKVLMISEKSINKDIYVPESMDHLFIINNNEEKAEVKIHISINAKLPSIGISGINGLGI